MSSLGTHTSQSPKGLGEFLKNTAEAKSPVPFLFELDNNVQPDVVTYSPSTKLVFRTQIYGPDTGSMYQGDAVAEGRKWVDTCYPTWKLNPANYYAPINEPGRSDAVGLEWLCNFYLGCMQRADELGVKLCVGEWSTGMPPISVAESQSIVSWLKQHELLASSKVLAYHTEVVRSANIYAAVSLEVDYISIYTPMLRYAKTHGHVLGLHEYSLDGPMIGNPLCLRYRQLYNALPQDARTTIYITEAGPDAGYATGYSGQAYIDVVGAYDLEVMKDSYVGGVALFKLGSGESNMAEVMPLLTEWVVAHPTKIDKEDVSMPFVFGIHSPASPGDVSTSDLLGIQRAAKFTGYKFLTGDTPTHYHQVLSLGIPPENCITRLFQKFNKDEPKPTPAQFCEWQSLAINEAMALGVIWFEIHNEPNLGASYGDASEWPYSDDPHDFIAWYLQVVALLKAQHPGIKVVSPGLSPQPNTQQWWNDMTEHGVFDVSDAIGAHVYWPTRGVMLTFQQGLSFVPLIPLTNATRKIFITEYSNNIGTDSDYDKGLQYCDWARYVQEAYTGVGRAYLYIVSSQTAIENDTRQTIVRSGVVSQIADGIRDGVIVLQERELDHWEDVDTGANLGSANPLSIVVTADRHIKAVTRPKATPLTVSVLTDGYGVVTGGGTYTYGATATLTWSPK